MGRDFFIQRKNDVLSKLDKSSKQSWDKKIISLCEKINSSEDYYTTSSCSGRVVLMIDAEKKGPGLFLNQYHNLISFNQLKQDLEKIIKEGIKEVKFKQEPCILHVACRDLKKAQEIFDLAKLAGLKKSGIIFVGKRFIVELNGTGKMEFPLIKNKKLLVGDDFLKAIVLESNLRFKQSWDKICKFENFFMRKYL